MCRIEIQRSQRSVISMSTRFKICCIQSIEEAQLAIDHGAAALGLVGKMPSGPGPIGDELIQRIARYVTPPVSTFLLTSEVEPDAIIAHCQATATDTVQLVDAPAPGAYEALRRTLPYLRIVQVLHVTGRETVEQVREVHSQVDAILLDSGNPNAQIRELGGTGRTHNWEISRAIVELASVPVFLAGGLNPDNVLEAVRTVNPFAVDICSGIRTNGRLDPQKLQAFARAVRASR